MKFIFAEADPLDEKIVTVAHWYDRHTRSWVVQSLNAADDQVGEADYCGHKAERDWCLKARLSAAPGARIVWLKAS